MFDKKAFKELLEKAIGERTKTEYANISGVNRTYISKYINEKLDSPPTPAIIKQLSDFASNGVSYEQLMVAAGYMDDDKTPRSQLNLKERIIETALASPMSNDKPSVTDRIIKRLIEKGLINEDGSTDEEIWEIIKSAIAADAMSANNLKQKNKK